MGSIGVNCIAIPIIPSDPSHILCSLSRSRLSPSWAAPRIRSDLPKSFHPAPGSLQRLQSPIFEGIAMERNHAETPESDALRRKAPVPPLGAGPDDAALLQRIKENGSSFLGTI